MSTHSTATSGKSGKPAAKATAGKVAATKPRAVRPAAAKARPKAGTAGTASVSKEDRKRLIAEAAYYKAKQRGFAEGGELRDWFEAEVEIDALLCGRGSA